MDNFTGKIIDELLNEMIKEGDLGAGILKKGHEISNIINSGIVADTMNCDDENKQKIVVQFLDNIYEQIKMFKNDLEKIKEN